MENFLNLEDEHRDSGINVLCLDVSSSCTGYSVLNCNFLTRKAVVTTAGALWLNPNVDNAQKYNYLSKCISEYFYVLGYVDYLVYEQYSINMKKRTGMLVTPEMIGAVKATIAELGLSYDAITPAAWRSPMKIKALISEINGERKRDFKTPVKNWVKARTNVPEKITSNITGKERDAPSDIFDGIGIAIGWGLRLTGAEGTPYFRNVSISKDLSINPHLSFNQL